MSPKGNVTDLLNVTPSNSLPYPLSPPPKAPNIHRVSPTKQRSSESTQNADYFDANLITVVFVVEEI